MVWRVSLQPTLRLHELVIDGVLNLLTWARCGPDACGSQNVSFMQEAVGTQPVCMVQQPRSCRQPHACRQNSRRAVISAASLQLPDQFLQCSGTIKECICASGLHGGY